MDREREISRAIQRSKRYWYEDGLAEMAGGSMLVLIGLLFWAEATLPLGPGLAALGLPFLVIGGGLATRYLVNVAKERLTYPRTGYVAYPRRRGLLPRGLTMLIAAVVAMLITFLIARAPTTLAWIPAMQGTILGAALLYWGYNLGLARFYVLAPVSALVGLAASFSGMGDTAGSALLFLTVGLGFLAGGLFTLRAYLRATTPVDS